MTDELAASEDLPVESASRPTPAALVAFVAAALVLSCAICSGQYLAWFFEQFGLMSASMGELLHTGKIAQIVQGIVLLGASLPLFAFTRNNLRPIYQGWLIASLFTFPAFVLRFVDANQDQLGSLIQIALGLAASAAAFAVPNCSSGRAMHWPPSPPRRSRSGRFYYGAHSALRPMPC